jgi:hypothetical protein
MQNFSYTREYLELLVFERWKDVLAAEGCGGYW